MKKVLSFYLKVCLVLAPLALMPGVSDALGFGKNWIMGAMMLVGVVIWAVGMVVTKEEKIVINKGLIWLTALSVWATIFWLGAEAGVRMRGLTGVPGLAMLWELTIWLFLWLQVREEERGAEIKWLTAGGLLMAVGSLVLFLIPSAKLPFSFPKNSPLISISQDWSASGSVMGEVWVLAILALIWTGKLMEKLKRRSDYVGEMAITAVLVLVLFLDIFKMVRSGWGYLDLNSSWVIASESLKYKALQGVGIGNFAEAFNWWKPASFNNHANWTAVFNWSGNTFLQLWTELGLVGLVMGMLAMWGLVGAQKKKGDKIIGIVLGLVMLLTPVTLVAFWLLVWWLVKGTENKEIKLVLRVGEAGTNIATWIVAVILISGSIVGAYWWVRIMMGEIYLYKSLVATASNDGGAAYNLQIKAINTNPNNAEFRRIYSQTNLALAVALMSNKEINDDQKQKAITLIQQSVREGKAAVALDNGNPLYWSNLAGIYRQLVGSIDGTADWSYQAYVQAATLDPTNPSLKLDFGGLMFSLGRYEEADRLFEQVVTLKQDLANGWYNWAYSARKLNKLGEAVYRLGQAVSLVPVTSGDYDTASKELDKWKEEYDKLTKQSQQQTKEAETLKVPEAIPSGTKSQVEVPNNGLEPPETEVTPTVAPTAAPTETQ